jgi:hypothetical protein
MQMERLEYEKRREMGTKRLNLLGEETDHVAKRNSRKTRTNQRRLQALTICDIKEGQFDPIGNQADIFSTNRLKAHALRDSLTASTNPNEIIF